MKLNGFFHPLLLACITFSTTALAAEPTNGPATDSATLEHGRYLLVTSGCNDCHTPGYMQTDGMAPPSVWLTGNPVGFQGPWGTTYPVNLRLHVQKISEAEWLERARKPMRPPMPWFNLRAMSDADLRAMYRYIHSLGPAGKPAPAAAAPGVAVSTPYIDFTPKNMPPQQAMK